MAKCNWSVRGAIEAVGVEGLRNADNIQPVQPVKARRARIALEQARISQVVDLPDDVGTFRSIGAIVRDMRGPKDD